MVEDNMCIKHLDVMEMKDKKGSEGRKIVSNHLP